jgi:uncharacterized protein involved in exopolysaccharide biosynthesis
MRENDYRSGRQDEISFIAVANVVLRRRSMILLIPLACALVAAGVRMSLPRTYTANASFMPQRSTPPVSGTLGTLAAQFGIAVPSGRPGESPAFYADLIRSRAVLEPVLATTYSFRQGRALRRGNIIDLYNIKGTGAARTEAGLRRLHRDVSVSTSRSTDIVGVSISAPWPGLSQQIAARVVELVNEFNLVKRQTEAHEERRFVQSRMEEAKRELSDSENRLADFLQRNRGASLGSPTLALTNDRLQREVTWRQQVFTSLAQAYEQARIDEVRNIPVITLIEEPTIPVRPDARGTIKWTAMAFTVGLIFSIVIAFSLEFSRYARTLPGDDFRELERLRLETLSDLKRPWRLLRRLPGQVTS